MFKSKPPPQINVHPKDRVQAFDATPLVDRLRALVSIYQQATEAKCPERCLVAIADAIVGSVEWSGAIMVVSEHPERY